MFSMYLSFYPLKSKSSVAIADALRLYITTQGVSFSINRQATTLYANLSIITCKRHTLNKYNLQMDIEPRGISKWKGIINKWYYIRFRAAMEWENLMAKDHGLTSIVKSDTRSISFRTISPLIFLPCFHKKENYVISVKSNDFEVPPVTIDIKSEPFKYICLCKFYNEKYAIVTVSREVPGYDARLYGLQLDRGTFVMPKCSSVPVPNAGNYMYSKINQRTAQAKHRMSVHGVVAETYQLKDFCKGDHPMTVDYDYDCRPLFRYIMFM
jgi:hypothetical protein